MKAISIWNPWASLIASGAKKIETRSWPTNYRGPILIHAAKRKNITELKDLAVYPAYFAALGIANTPFSNSDMAFLHLKNLPYGALVALADLVDCKRVEKISLDTLNWVKASSGGTFTEFDLGNYDAGRYGWILENVRPFIKPVEYKGEQGLFEVPGNYEDQICLSIR